MSFCVIVFWKFDELCWLGDFQEVLILIKKMLRPLKQIILILIGVGFLWGFYSSIEKSFSVKNLKVAESSESEKEDTEAEFEDLKFLSQDAEKILQNSLQKQLANNEILSFSQYFLEVPVSPPNL